MVRPGSSMSRAFKAAACLVILAMSITCASAGRTLIKDLPLVAPITPPTMTTAATTIAPATVPIPTTQTIATVPIPTIATVPIPTTATVPIPTATAPTAGVIPTGPAVTTTTTAHEDAHQPLTFFMHDILGGSNPSARVVTGIVSNPAVNGQLPFAKPNGPVLPGNGGVNIPNGNNNGVINNINNNNIPFLTGLGGQTTSTVINNNGNNIIGGNGLPFFNAGQLPAGSTMQKLLFGTMTVIDDVLTEGHELGSGVVGKAQGFYVASSEDGTSQTMAFTAMFQNGHYADSLCFFGVHKTAMDESQLAVMGGTGKYVNAKGYATAKTLHSVGQTETDGAETLLELTVYLA